MWRKAVVGRWQKALVISITHLRIDPAYQQERERRLARVGESHEPSSFTRYSREKKQRR